MEKLNKFKILISLLSFLLMINFAFSVQDFSLNKAEILNNIQTSQNGNSDFTITNTGDETISLNIVKSNFKKGESEINYVLNASALNLDAGESKTIGLTYTAGQVSGEFKGRINITNSQNSQTKSIVLTLNVAEIQLNKPSLKFLGEDKNLKIEIDLDKSSKTKRFKLYNNGDSTLQDITLELDDEFSSDDDEIQDNDFEINGEDGDDLYEIDEDENNDDFTLAPGEEYEIKFKIDISSSWDIGDYDGSFVVKYKTLDNVSYSNSFNLEIEASKDDLDVKIDLPSNFEIVVEPGETLDDIEIPIKNNEKIDLENYRLELEDDLEEEDSSKTLSKSKITFLNNPFTINEDDTEDLEIKVDVPDNQAIGTYSTDLELYDSDGDKVDSVNFKVRIIGDVYIKEIKFADQVQPGDDLKIEITTSNKGSQIYRGIKIVGSLENIEYGNGDITESTSSFILESDESKTETLKFKIPKDARDGEHTLEIRVLYDNNEIFEVESVKVKREDYNILIDSYSVNPNIAKCDQKAYTYLKFRNLGKYDTDVKVEAEILGEGIRDQTNTYEVEVDEVDTKSLFLSLKDLKPGTYTVVHKISYNGVFKKEENEIRILECNKNNTGIDFKPINETEENKINRDVKAKIDFGGKEVEISKGESKVIKFENKNYIVKLSSVTSTSALLNVNGKSKLVTLDEPVDVQGIVITLDKVDIKLEKDKNKLDLFGHEFEKTTIYLGSGLVLIVLFIIVGVLLL